jgi:hypothetical protein
VYQVVLSTSGTGLGPVAITCLTSEWVITCDGKRQQQHEDDASTCVGQGLVPEPISSLATTKQMKKG